MAKKLTHAEYAAKHTEIFARMSANFLATPLPSDWDTWEEEKLDNFLSDNHWQPFEYWDVNDVYGLIDQLTIDVMNLMGLEMSRTKSQEFWAWIDQCPDGVYVNHDSTDDEDEKYIYVFGFAVPKEIADE